MESQLPHLFTQIRYTLIGGPESPWTAMFWWLALLMCGIFAIFEAMREVSRCVREIHHRKQHDRIKEFDQLCLTKHAPFSWFGSYQKTPWTVVITEILVRVIFVIVCGLFNGILSLFFAWILVPALLWCWACWFVDKRKRYVTVESFETSDDEDK